MTASLRPVGGEPWALLRLLSSWWQTPDGPLVVRTSGSTGVPKDVLLSRDALRASAQATHARLGGPGQWLLDLPTSGVAGLQVLVRSVVAGTSPVVVAEHVDLESALDALDGDRTYASLVPTQLHRLDRDGRLGVLARLDSLLVGGAAIDPGLLARAVSAGVHVVRTYGMSETAGGCVYDGVPLDGVSVRIEDGEVLIAGPTLFDGYDGLPRTSEWFATGDLGELEDGVLRITGRRDDIIKVGGAKVALPAVERAVRQVAEVADAAVVAVPDPEWGSRVVAFVVPSDAVCLDGLRPDALRDALVENGLERRWAPRDVVLVDALPLLPGGKIDRVGLRAQADRSGS